MPAIQAADCSFHIRRAAAHYHGNIYAARNCEVSAHSVLRSVELKPAALADGHSLPHGYRLAIHRRRYICARNGDPRVCKQDYARAQHGGFYTGGAKVVAEQRICGAECERVHRACRGHSEALVAVPAPCPARWTACRVDLFEVWMCSFQVFFSRLIFSGLNLLQDCVIFVPRGERHEAHIIASAEQDGTLARWVEQLERGSAYELPAAGACHRVNAGLGLGYAHSARGNLGAGRLKARCCEALVKTAEVGEAGG